MPELNQIFEIITGPNGGLFALGVFAGYFVAMYTVLKEAKARIAALEKENRELHAQLIDEIRKRSVEV